MTWSRSVGHQSCKPRSQETFAGTDHLAAFLRSRLFPPQIDSFQGLLGAQLIGKSCSFILFAQASTSLERISFTRNPLHPGAKQSINILILPWINREISSKVLFGVSQLLSRKSLNLACKVGMKSVAPKSDRSLTKYFGTYDTWVGYWYRRVHGQKNWRWAKSTNLAGESKLWHGR